LHRRPWHRRWLPRRHGRRAELALRLPRNDAAGTRGPLPEPVHAVRILRCTRGRPYPAGWRRAPARAPGPQRILVPPHPRPKRSPRGPNPLRQRSDRGGHPPAHRPRPCPRRPRLATRTRHSRRPSLLPAPSPPARAHWRPGDRL